MILNECNLGDEISIFFVGKIMEKLNMLQQNYREKDQKNT